MMPHTPVIDIPHRWAVSSIRLIWLGAPNTQHTNVFPIIGSRRSASSNIFGTPSSGIFRRWPKPCWKDARLGHHLRDHRRIHGL